MGRNAGLTQAGDFLELVHRKLVLLQQRQNSQAGRVGQSTERSQGGSHEKIVSGDRKKPELKVDALGNVYIFPS
jgi:hypothetical protein